MNSSFGLNAFVTFEVEAQMSAFEWRMAAQSRGKCMIVKPKQMIVLLAVLVSLERRACAQQQTTSQWSPQQPAGRS